MKREIVRKIVREQWTVSPKVKVARLGLVCLLAVLIEGCSGGPSFEKALERADAAYEAGEIEKARIDYLNCYQKDSTDPHVLVRLGTIYMDRKEVSAAVYFLKRAAEIAPEHIEGRLILARVYRAVGGNEGFRLCRDESLAILDIDPVNPEAMILYADASVTPELIQEAFAKMGAMPDEAKKIPEYHRALGTLYLRLGNTARAEERFRTAMDMAPDDSGPYLDLANLYSSAGNAASANAMFAEAVNRSPDEPMTALKWAVYRNQNGNRAGAKEVLQDILEKNPEHAPSLAHLAEIEYNEKNYDAASQLADRVLAIDDQNFSSLLIKAQLKLARDDVAGAIASFTELSNRFEESWQVYYGLALAQAKQGESSQAIENLGLAIEKAENRDYVYTDAILMRAELQLNTSDYESVIEAVPAVIEKEPKNVRAYNVLSRAYQMANDDEMALEVYQSMREALGSTLEIEYAEGKLLAKMNRLPEAKERFARGLESVPKSLAFLGELVDIEVRMGEHSAALNRLDAFEMTYKDELEPNDIARLASIRGAILKSQGDLEGAGAAFLEATELNPQDVASLSELAQIFGALGRLDEAIEKLEGSLSQNNDAPGLLLQLGLLYEQKEDFQSAATYYEKLIDVAPDTIVALNNLAYILAEKLGNIEKGLELAIRAHRIASGNSGSGVSGSGSYLANQAAYRIFTTDTLSWIRYKNGEYQEAYRLAKVVVESGAAMAEMSYHFALSAYMTGRLEEARDAIAQATVEGADYAGLEDAKKFQSWLSRLDGIGNQYDLDYLLAIAPEAAKGPVDESLLMAVDQRLEEQPEDVVAIRIKALASVRANEFEEARAYLESALAINPEYSNALFDIGVLDLVDQLWEEANGRLRQARENTDPSDGLLFALGVAAMETGDFDYSKLLFGRVGSEYRLTDSVQFRLAQTLLCQGEVEAARTRLESLSQVASPKVARYHEIAQALASGEGLGSASNIWGASEEGRIAFDVADAVALELSGSVSESVPAYEAILSRSPEATLCAVRLAGIYAETGENLENARRYAASARAALGQSPALARISGLIEFRLGNFEEAVPYLEMAREADDSDPAVSLALGILQLEADSADSTARSMLRSALQSAPDHWLASRANEALTPDVESEN